MSQSRTDSHRQYLVSCTLKIAEAARELLQSWDNLLPREVALRSAERVADIKTDGESQLSEFHQRRQALQEDLASAHHLRSDVWHSHGQDAPLDDPSILGLPWPEDLAELRSALKTLQTTYLAGGACFHQLSTPDPRQTAQAAMPAFRKAWRQLDGALLAERKSESPAGTSHRPPPDGERMRNHQADVSNAIMKPGQVGAEEPSERSHVSVPDGPHEGGEAPNRDAVLANLQPAARKAYLSYEIAESKAERQLKDRQAYDVLHEEGFPDDAGDLGELTDYKLPGFTTWSRQLRVARNRLGNQKHSPRRGRQFGPSVVSEDQI